jgi:hypothetical protein
MINFNFTLHINQGPLLVQQKEKGNLSLLLERATTFAITIVRSAITIKREIKERSKEILGKIR